MEKLGFTTNGQWTLEKAAPKLKNLLGAYDARADQPSHYYTGQDKAHRQRDVLNAIIRHPMTRNAKIMNNVETGKPEMHVLVHHGIEANTYNPKMGEARGQGLHNNMDFTHPDYVDHKTFGVHALDPDVAGEYGDVHSFWVPMSKFHGMRSKVEGRVKNTRQRIPRSAYEGQEHIAGSKVIYSKKGVPLRAEDIKRPMTAMDMRDIMANDSHAEAQAHVSVEPGKYRHASRNDLENMYAKAHNYVNDPKLKIGQRAGTVYQYSDQDLPSGQVKHHLGNSGKTLTAKTLSFQKLKNRRNE